MAPKARVSAIKCVNLVLKALRSVGGDHAIIRSGRVPLITRHADRYRMSDSTVPREAVSEMAEYLLPAAEKRALNEIGETRYHLPHRPEMGFDDFIVDVTVGGGDICVDIERHVLPESDNDLPPELFQSRLDC